MPVAVAGPLLASRGDRAASAPVFEQCATSVAHSPSRQRQPRSLGCVTSTRAMPLQRRGDHAGFGDARLWRLENHVRLRACPAVFQSEVAKIDDCECPRRLTRQRMNQILKGLRKSKFAQTTIRTYLSAGPVEPWEASGIIRFQPGRVRP
jgi:hypothetical protein